ncbi:quinolinate synthase NadA [Salinibacter ruber]|uniref:quinolinate synthase NadA n=1 Tax=Salinibacter ruber TaxID=146919 RepID=UPI0020732C7B|nr:quinolinate synthase NadA [Salinibacter ruber]MCS3636593.1 quinolinate synthase [Salinibacter ruber]MCS3701054.1 quinolinate synthase [Salinibacter ruber]MCS4097423.1 quinolinate synthase [Salinibacter ruber]MCS4141541.1 quinolinate synthase [Salinibacter ruber]MCS4178808.1 quinolinate synthase [Salinibacter ruber]
MMNDAATLTDPDAFYDILEERLEDRPSDPELRNKAEMAAEINALKQEQNAVILGHNYMEPALFHTIPDYTGSSLELSRRAAEAEADTIVFCGVRFMAETAKIVNPDKTVLLPAEEAGCSLAESITAEDVRRLRERYPGLPVVTYVNTYADVKAESDVCCTSSNAAQVVESLDSDTVIFIPDEFLAQNVAQETGKDVLFPQKRERKDVGGDGAPTSGDGAPAEAADADLIGWEGRCVVHEMFQVEDVQQAREEHPDTVVLAHPECSPEVVEEADHSGSTSSMIDYVENTDAESYLLLTECSMGDNIMGANPDKNLLRMCWQRCPHMNQITLEDTYRNLANNQYKIEIEEEVRLGALEAVERMLEIG